jgi:hypothetical protein
MNNKTIEKIILGIAMGSIVTFFLFAAMVIITPAHAENKDEICKPIVQTITNTVTKTVLVNHPVEVIKIVRVEVPVYETMTVTSDSKTVRAMMKVTHDRYLALLAKYRELVKAKK